MTAPERDSLTNLRRKEFLLKQFLEIVSQPEIFLSLIWIDIDGLIFLNDKYSHTEGDIFLQQVAQIIVQVVPQTSEVFRIAGDEFAFIVTKLDLPEVLAIAEEIRKKVETQFSDIAVLRRLGKTNFAFPTFIQGSPTVSCAIAPALTCQFASYPQHGTEIDSLLQAADRAMYEKAKLFGENKVVLA
ncbi:MAG TPA: GGDEF domain-containing protein [Oculatellaceae cyanobacterium]|jgi:diguanylate cyclase (GGDEF)-like protein